MLQGEHSAILSTFMKLPFIFKIFVLSIFEWPFYTGFTVLSVSFQVLQSSRWGRDNWLLYFNCLLAVTWQFKSSMSHLRGAMGWTAVYDCGISWSYLLFGRNHNKIELYWPLYTIQTESMYLQFWLEPLLLYSLSWKYKYVWNIDLYEHSTKSASFHQDRGLCCKYWTTV